MSISRPVNDVQREFNKLCNLGGGRKGGPARGKVQELLHQAGSELNALAHNEIVNHLSTYSDRNPWHVCFAVGICWGHLAKLDLTFTEAAVNLLEDWNDADLKTARSFHLERGPDPVEQSLKGGSTLFPKVILPKTLPESLEGYGRAQERWLTPILSPSRPKYIGSWNATAMFMVGLFSNAPLAAHFTTRSLVLPPGGPIFNALSILHDVGILIRPPAGSDLDDEAFEPGALYENNALFEDILQGHTGWSILDVHSGLYMLGTKLAQSDEWFKL